MNILMWTEYPPYRITNHEEVPRLLDVIYGKKPDTSYNAFKFYTKSPKEKKAYFKMLQKFYPYTEERKGYVLWLIDSPRMTHLATNEILELEVKGYANIILIGRKSADTVFFSKNPTNVIIPQIKKIINEYEIKHLITPCLNVTHNKILDELSIYKIGIQHGYGTWVEAKMIHHVNRHYNFGYISSLAFDRDISKIAGYSPTKLYPFYEPEDNGYILYLSQGSKFTNKGNIIYNGVRLVEVAKYFNMPLIIKSHFDATGEFDDVKEARVYTEGEINTEELIRKASIVITSWSGSGVESIYFNKPTIIIDTQKDNGKFFSSSGLVVKPAFEAVKNRIKGILEGKQFLQEKFSTDINYKGGLEASKIITEDI